MAERFYLYDETESTQTRFISFMGKILALILAIITSNGIMENTWSLIFKEVVLPLLDMMI